MFRRFRPQRRPRHASVSWHAGALCARPSLFAVEMAALRTPPVGIMRAAAPPPRVHGGNLFRSEPLAGDPRHVTRRGWVAVLCGLRCLNALFAGVFPRDPLSPIPPARLAAFQTTGASKSAHRFRTLRLKVRHNSIMPFQTPPVQSVIFYRSANGTHGSDTRTVTVTVTVRSRFGALPRAGKVGVMRQEKGAVRPSQNRS
jgi:hypothetical protein